MIHDPHLASVYMRPMNIGDKFTTYTDDVAYTQTVKEVGILFSTPKETFFVSGSDLLTILAKFESQGD